MFTTAKPVPYLPAMLIWSAPLHAKSLAKYGSAVYNIDPKTAVTCGPYMLEEFSPDNRVTATAERRTTRAQLKPLTDRLVANIVTGGSDFARYQAGEIDSVASVSVGDVKTVLADPALKEQFFVNPGDFRCYYIFFDITKAPFTDKKVRLAFAKAIDREAIVSGILAPIAIPAYSWLMPGFPDANEDELKPIQAFDPAAAKQLLSDAGFPDGKGFPAQTLIIRGGGPDSTPAVTQAVVASITQTLGVQIDLQTMDQAPFMDELLKKPTQHPVRLGHLRHGLPRRHEHAERVEERRPAQLEQRRLRQARGRRRRDHQRSGGPEQGDEGRREAPRRRRARVRSSTTRSSASSRSPTARAPGRTPTRPATPAPSGPVKGPSPTSTTRCTWAQMSRPCARHRGSGDRHDP